MLPLHHPAKKRKNLFNSRGKITFCQDQHGGIISVANTVFVNSSRAKKVPESCFSFSEDRNNGRNVGQLYGSKSGDRLFGHIQV